MAFQGRLKYPLRLFHTLRHLRLRQIVYQVWYRLYRGSMPVAPKLDLRPLSQVQSWLLKPVCWAPGEAFTFLNERRPQLASGQWEQVGASKLWLYNLHYFDYLLTEPMIESSSVHAEKVFTDYQQRCTTLIDEWVAQNISVRGTGWESYPTSLRIVNWIKWHGESSGLSLAAQSSLAQQVQWLASRLEFHILANHLFANAKALVFAGLFFDGARADAWLAKGVALVSRELQEQILEDGAHFELSPMYHATLLEDVCDLINYASVASGAVPETALSAWRAFAERMLRWQNDMLHPDGEIAFFNDAAFGIARTPAELADYAKRLGLNNDNTSPAVDSCYLRASGFGVMSKGGFTVIAKVASVAPSYQPGHTHADSLSCEVSYGVDRVFVNAGTSIYSVGDLRHQQRSTAAHNTLELDGENSSDVWGGFRVARRANTAVKVWSNDEKATFLHACHDGYRNLPGRPNHTRQWRLNVGGLQVIDQVNSLKGTSYRPEVVVRWLMHPTIQPIEGHRLKTASGHELEWSIEGGDGHILPALWYPKFGTEEATHCIVIKAADEGDCRLKFNLYAPNA